MEVFILTGTCWSVKSLVRLVRSVSHESVRKLDPTDSTVTRSTALKFANAVDKAPKSYRLVIPALERFCHVQSMKRLRLDRRDRS